ncbi:MAG: hypothetical protein K2O88_02855, partial [Paramuribaculum sp.]|nr:hypothetical protein [Paramuribaculum sp.]
MGWMEVVMKKDNWKSDYDETVALDARNIMTRNTEIQGTEIQGKRGGKEKRKDTCKKEKPRQDVLSRLRKGRLPTFPLSQ